MFSRMVNLPTLLERYDVISLSVKNIMKILFQVSTYGYKTYHSLAKRLKEIYPEINCGIAGGQQ